MELYGRPQVARRNTSSGVLFLNEATKARAAVGGFTPPTSARGLEKDVGVLELQVTGERAASNNNTSEPSALVHQSKPPSSARPLERPQSGGVQRPAPGAPPPSGSGLKQRPSTARERSRTSRLYNAPPSIGDPVFQRRSSIENVPETNEISPETGKVGAAESPDEAYVQQLKADVLFCHQLLDHERSRSHTHVKNVQSMRETAIHSLLARYNFSSDPQQLLSAKRKLEGLLGDTLTQLMKQFMELKDELIDSDTTEERPEQEPVDPIGLQRPPGSSLPFNNGCGLNAASIYTGSLVGVLQSRAVLGLQAEKALLVKDLQGRDRQLERLNEQLELFKEALAKAVVKRSGREQWRSIRRNLGNATAEETAKIFHENVQGPELDLEKQLETTAKLNASETERIQLEEQIVKLRAEHGAMAEKWRAAKAEAERNALAVSAANAAMEDAIEKAAKDAREKALARDQKERELDQSLTTLKERYRQLEESTNQEKQAFRDDSRQLTTRIRKLEEELKVKVNQQNDTAKRERERADVLTNQLRNAEKKLTVAEKESESLRRERNRENAIQIQLRQELTAASATIEQLKATMEHLRATLQEAEACRSTQEMALRQAELRLSQAHADAERQASVVQHQANQLILLETKLSRSISVDEDALRQRRIDEETAWHQKLASVEHALAVERQTIESLKEQHEISLTRERERADYTATQTKTIALELETANLCLAERKKQREREIRGFDEQKMQLLSRIHTLTIDIEEAKETIRRYEAQPRFESERQTLETRIRCELESQLADAAARESRVQTQAQASEQRIRDEFESLRQRVDDEIQSYKAAAENALAAELEIRQRLDVVSCERDVLQHKLQDERATPQGAALSETRVDLQKARLKIAALEEKLGKLDSSRGKDADAKGALLRARERKSLEDQKSLKKLKQELSAEKKQLETEREDLDAERGRVDSDKSKNQKEHALVRETISLLAAKLSLQLQLLQILPTDAAQRDRPARTLSEFVQSLQRDQSDQWREMQAKWEGLQHELDEADWQLVLVRRRLEELDLHPPAKLLARPKTPSASPFSDAVAAGRETVPVAQQLLAKPEQHDSDIVSTAARVRDEDQDTFAAALAKEMRAMKSSFEAQLEQLQQELRTAQRRRAETSQRLRAELDDEKRRSQQSIAQLTDRCTALEAQLLALQTAWSCLQERQISILERFRRAGSDAARSQLLTELLEAAESAWREELATRQQREAQRVEKLLAYCGSSSVAVQRDDKDAARLQ